MEITLNQVPVILIIGGISLYFLFSGLLALLKNRMTVVNPHADTPSTSVNDVIFDLLKKRAAQDYPVPENFSDKSKYTQIHGNELKLRALFHLVMGLISMLVLLCFLSEKVAEKTMNFFL
ncbi:MAG: hypothetical protein C0620_07820 [Desulfuromonas sp.]|nr:MAG: hypothetical protein C0620_07820 [Desulfuromonas sp.]